MVTEGTHRVYAVLIDYILYSQPTGDPMAYRCIIIVLDLRYNFFKIIIYKRWLQVKTEEAREMYLEAKKGAKQVVRKAGSSLVSPYRLTL